MLALVQAEGGEIITLHRTYLTRDGRKAHVPSPKILMACYLPGSMKGAAIRLYPATEILALTEGIETALAVRRCTGLPVWATVSASGLSKVQLPDAVKTVIICADHDKPGIDGGKKLADRLLREGRAVKLIYPDTPGADWADALEVDHARQTHR